LSSAARRESATRPGAQATARAAGAAAGAAARQASDADLAGRAEAAGFTDLHSLLAATSALAAHEVAAMLGVPVKRVWTVRRRYGYLAARRGRPPGLAPDATQPCLECHRFFRGLGQHLAHKHGLTLPAYRARHPTTAGELERTAGQPADPRRPPVGAAALARIRRGVQPEDHGRQLCLECGHWYRGLAHHLPTHRLTIDEYRRRHGLPSGVVRGRAR
jgi:predicted transcriptional regulator